MIPRNGLIKTRFEVTADLVRKYPASKIIFYSLAFEEGIEDYKAFVGLSDTYISREKKSTVALEAHNIYLKKMDVGVFQVETRICDFDGKKVRIFQEIFQDTDLVASQETLSISFDILSRKTCKFNHSIAKQYAELHIAQKELDEPKSTGLSLKRRFDYP